MKLKKHNLIKLCLISLGIILLTTLIWYFSREKFYNYSVTSPELKLTDTSKKVLIVSGLYNIPGKHSPESYKKYVANWLPYIENAAVVFFADDYYYDYVKSIIPTEKMGKSIMLIKLPIEEFKTYKLYEAGFKGNFEKIKTVYDADYRKQMIWGEKINFMYEAYLLYPSADWIMWIDAGYFRDSDLDPTIAKSFPKLENLEKLDKNKTHLIRLCNDDWVSKFREMVNVKSNPNNMLADKNIDYNSAYLAGGCIITYKSNLYDIWFLYYKYLQHFILNNREFLDDQMILGHIAFDNAHFDKFNLIKAPDDYKKDRWFYVKDLLTV